MNQRQILRSKTTHSEYYITGETVVLEGSFSHTRFTADNGFVIGTFQPKEHPEIICKGIIPGLVLGAPYKLTGKVVMDKTYGQQIDIIGVEGSEPSTKQEIIAFLGSGSVKGIGMRTARIIYDHFKEDTLSILEDNPDKLREVKGIGNKNIEKIKISLKKVLGNREIIGYFAQFGISMITINCLIDQYGKQTKEKITKNPYLLCRVRGFAFTRADSIAMKLGVSKLDQNRLYAGILATLRYSCQQSGNTLLPREMLVRETYSKLGINELEPIDKALNKLLKDNRLIEDERGIHLPHLYRAEKSIKDCLVRASKPSEIIEEDDIQGLLIPIKKEMGIELTSEQLSAVYNAFTRPLTVLTGGAGCGKTATCEMIVRLADAAEIPVCLISPTGRAAKHLSEVCGKPGYTMHRALSLGISKVQDDDFFNDNSLERRNLSNMSEAIARFKKSQLVLADEASMMDTEMAAVLLTECRGKNLVLIGDPNQLPSVGPGSVLKDIIDTNKGSLVQLKQVFRQAEGSPIIRAAENVEQGLSPCSVEGIEYYECSNEEVQDVLTRHFIPVLEKEKLGYEDFMVIAPIKKTPVSGVEALNKFLRTTCNKSYKPQENPNKEFLLQKGDFVSQKKNNYEVDIFNGDIGVVTNVVDGEVEVLFSDSPETVIFESDEVQENLMLAYASSVHRQQGSQAHTVVVICTMSHFALLNRNLLYTAITRAQKRLILVGEKKAFAMAAGNAKETQRLTGLSK